MLCFKFEKSFGVSGGTGTWPEGRYACRSRRFDGSASHLCRHYRTGKLSTCERMFAFSF